jgi:hypothetical protein
MPPKKPVVPKAAPKPKAKPPTVDPFFAKLQEENRKRMQAASEPGRRAYKPGQSTGRPDSDAAKKAGFAK